MPETNLTRRCAIQSRLDFRASLSEWLEDWRPDLVIFDPWNSAARDDGQRDYLGVFQSLKAVLPKADATPALVIVAHTRKPRGDERKTGRGLLNDVAGSHALVSVPRTVFIMQHGTDDEQDDRIWTCFKNNDGELGSRTAWHRRNGQKGDAPMAIDRLLIRSRSLSCGQDMELRHLRYFVAVAENLNFTKAAARLHLAQPSLTRQIHNLEEEIGVRLLNRSKSQVDLTEEGRAFLVDARRVLTLATESVQAVQRLSRGETGQLNIAYSSNFNFELLPETLGAFRRSFPHIALNLFDMTPAEQFRALEARKIDLGFVGLRPPPSTRGLQWESIARHRTVVVLPEKHPLARKRRIKLRELKTMFFVGMSEKTHPGFRDWLCETCQPAGFKPKILQDAELEPALMTFVAEGLGVTLAREHIKKLPHPGVAFRPLAPSVKADYCIAWNRDNDSRALQQYIQIVKNFTAPAVFKIKSHSSAVNP